MKIEIVNGPNLNLLGRREPEIYGTTPFDVFLDELRRQFPDVEIGYYQSNVEGLLIDHLQHIGFSADGIVLNAGAYTHTSLALYDCLRALTSPVVEVHISNTAARSAVRHTSIIAPACVGTIAGFGLDSYRLAIEALLRHGN